MSLAGHKQLYKVRFKHQAQPCAASINYIIIQLQLKMLIFFISIIKV